MITACSWVPVSGDGLVEQRHAAEQRGAADLSIDRVRIEVAVGDEFVFVILVGRRPDVGERRLRWA